MTSLEDKTGVMRWTPEKPPTTPCWVRWKPRWPRECGAPSDTELGACVKHETLIRRELR